MDTSGYKNSSSTTNKQIKSSSAYCYGFSVPLRVVPLSNLSSADKNKWLRKFKTELGQVQTFQKKVHMNRTTFSLVLKKECGNLLKKLMSHQHGSMFNKPVDVVEYGIPDYHDFIKNPMDLGTIKEKLRSGKYSSPLDFLADVRLTFSNAMSYNPPGNDVHVMADILSKFFEQRWKPIEKKLNSQKKKVNEDVILSSSKKRKITMMTNEEKCDLSRELEIHLHDLPDNIIDLLREYCSNDNEAGDDEIEVDIDDLDNEALLKLRRMLDDYMQEKQNHTKAESCVIELLNESGISNSTMQLYKDKDVDIVGNNEPPVFSYHRVEIEKETNNIQSTSGASSESISGLDQVKHISGQIAAAKAAKAKTKRNIEREAARHALLKMQKTVEINGTCPFLHDWEILRNPESKDGLAGNPLEQLGLYIKRDEHEEEVDNEYCIDI